MPGFDRGLKRYGGICQETRTDISLNFAEGQGVADLYVQKTS